MKEWIITSNLNRFDVIGAFNKFNKINREQKINVEPGDIVFIYISEPVSAIKYKCVVTKVDLPHPTVDNSEFKVDGIAHENVGKYMELQLLERLDNPALAYDKLKENGLNAVQGPSKVTTQLSNYIQNMTAGITDKEAESLIAENDENILSAKIKAFQLWIKKNKVTESELEQKRQKFVNDYTFKVIMEMKKEEYVVGLGRKDSFCYRLETELQDLGDIHGATSTKFGMYYGASGKDSEKKYRIVSKFGDDPDRALEKIKEEIVNLILAGEKKDYASIRECALAPIFRGKILATFYPESYLCIFSKEHLEYFLSKLNIPFSGNEDELDKQLKLLHWKETNTIINSWAPLIFEKFLYTSYGNPSEMNKIAKEKQEDRDKNYPKDYVVKIGVTIDQWKELLQNPEIFLEKDLDIMRRIYLSENHAATCYELGLQDGVSPSTYIKPVVALGRRISRQLELNPIIRPDGSEAWWCIPFWGSYREDNHFEWKIRPKLAKALVSVFPELELLKSEDHEEDEDDNLVEDLKNVVVKKLEAGYEYKGKPKKKKAPIYSKGRKTYLRDRQTALNALAHAEYKCEIDLDHITFKRRKAPDVNYTEPHHLVPMAHSDQFEISLDVEENIVSLCSNCHNHLHYGQGSEDLLKRLFDERKEDLKRAGIDISFETLMSMY